MHHDRWVRFHTLPEYESKWYPDSEEDYVTILDRHHALLEELQLADHCFVTLFADDLAAVPPADSTLLPRASHWRTVAPDDDEDMPMAAYASEVAHPSQELDGLLRAPCRRRGGRRDHHSDGCRLLCPRTAAAPTSSLRRQRLDDLREKFQSWRRLTRATSSARTDGWLLLEPAAAAWIFDRRR